MVAGRLGALLKEWDATGGLDASAVPQGPMLGAARMDLDGRLTVETTLDPALQPFLDDHRIDGTPVLPGVMGIEGFAEAALSIAPGWQVEAVEDIEFLAPFKFYRGEPRPVTIEARVPSRGRRPGRGLPADRPSHPRQPGRSAGGDPLHRPRPPGEATPPKRRTALLQGPRPDRPSRPRTSTASTSTARPTGC